MNNVCVIISENSLTNCWFFLTGGLRSLTRAVAPSAPLMAPLLHSELQKGCAVLLAGAMLFWNGWLCSVSCYGPFSRDKNDKLADNLPPFLVQSHYHLYQFSHFHCHCKQMRSQEYHNMSNKFLNMETVHPKCLMSSFSRNIPTSTDAVLFLCHHTLVQMLDAQSCNTNTKQLADWILQKLFAKSFGCLSWGNWVMTTFYWWPHIAPPGVDFLGGAGGCAPPKIF